MGEGRKLPDVSERILKDVRDYIERMMGADGTLRRSLHVIGDDLGYSHASIHRALLVLEARGELEIDRSVHPNVIRFKGERRWLRPDSAAELADALLKAEEIFSRLKSAYLTLVDDNRMLREIAAEWMALKPNLVDRLYLRDRQELILTFKVDVDADPRLQRWT